MPGLQQLWSTTPGNNQTSDPSINWREGQGPSTVNDSSRMMMARIAAYLKDISGILVTSGTSSAYTLTTNEGFTSLVDGMVVGFNVHTSNADGPITLNVDGQGAKPLRLIPSSDVVPASCFRLGAPYTAQFSVGNGGEWRVRGALDALMAPVGTRMVFQQTAAPVGWVKEAGAGFNNRALRLTTGVVGSGGTTDFTTVFASRALSIANLPAGTIGTAQGAGAHSHTGSATSAGDHTHLTDSQGSHTHGGTTTSDGNHNHSTGDVGSFITTAGGAGGAAPGAGTAFNFRATTADAGTHSHTLNVSAAGAHTHTAQLAGAHTHALAVDAVLDHTHAVSSAGTGTALDFAVAYHDVIVATRS